MGLKLEIKEVMLNVVREKGEREMLKLDEAVKGVPGGGEEG